jgi:hypothetical protein
MPESLVKPAKGMHSSEGMAARSAKKAPASPGLFDLSLPFS